MWHISNLNAVGTDTNCPVCGFEMGEPPADYNICPSCGTEFGVSDVNASIEQLRRAWIATGPVWWFTVESPPPNWNPLNQLEEFKRESANAIRPCEFAAPDAKMDVYARVAAECFGYPIATSEPQEAFFTPGLQVSSEELQLQEVPWKDFFVPALLGKNLAIGAE